MLKGQMIEKKISTYSLRPGIYWIRVTNENGEQIDMKKVIIAR
jgi:hypothetical protein